MEKRQFSNLIIYFVKSFILKKTFIRNASHRETFIKFLFIFMKRER